MWVWGEDGERGGWWEVWVWGESVGMGWEVGSEGGKRMTYLLQSRLHQEHPSASTASSPHSDASNLHSYTHTHTHTHSGKHCHTMLACPSLSDMPAKKGPSLDST